jgi:hypothetical protein
MEATLTDEVIPALKELEQHSIFGRNKQEKIDKVERGIKKLEEIGGQLNTLYGKVKYRADRITYGFLQDIAVKEEQQVQERLAALNELPLL